MKKILLSLCAAAVCLGASAAETVLVMADRFDSTQDLASWTQEGFTMTASVAEGTNTPTYNNNGKDVRLYAKNTFEVASESTITSISFELSKQGKQRLCEVVASTGSFGEFAVDIDNVVWTGSASSVVFTVDPNNGRAQFGTDGASKAGQFDFLSMTIVTEGGETTVAAPVFSPDPGTYYTAQTVTISCRSTGATIYYQLNDALGFSPYDGEEIEVEETTTIKAYAEKGDVRSEIVEANYIIAELPSCNSLAAALELAKDLENKAYTDPFIVNFEPVVTYVNGANTYVAEGGHYCLIYKSGLDIEAGHKVAKGWEARIQNFNGLLELVPAATATVVAGAEAEIPEPIYITNAADINQSVLSAVVYVIDVTFAEATPADRKTFTGKMGDTDVTFYNNYSLDSQAAGTYNVKATIGSYNALQVQPIEYLLPAAITTPSFDDNAAVEYFNLQGIRIETPAAGQIVIRRQGSEVTKMMMN